MNKKVLKALSFSVAMLMTASVFAGCGSKTTKTEGTKTETTAAVETTAEKAAVKEVEKPKKINFMSDTLLIKEDGLDQLLAKYKEITGIELVITQPAHNQYQEKLKLTIASGENIDAAEIYSADYVNFSSNGVFAPLKSYIDNSELFKPINKEYFEALTLADGEIYGVPMNTGGGCITYVRQDWLDNLGLEMPKTWDEYYELMKAFTFNDPDKNGQNDTFGYTGPGVGVDSDWYIRDFYQDASPDLIVKDGKWIDGFSQPEFKEALVRLNKAYSEGLIDKEIFTNKTSTCRDKFYAGKVGLFTYWAGTWNRNMQVNTEPNFPNAKVAAMPPVEGSYYNNRVPYVTSVLKKSKNAEGVFKYLVEFMHDGAEGQKLFTFGVEGVHYEVKDGKIEMMPRISDPKKPLAKTYHSPELQLNPFTIDIDPNLDPLITGSLKIFMDNAKQQQLIPESATWAKRAGDIRKLKEEIIAKTMISEYSIDDGLALYATKSKELGMDKVLEEINK